MAYGTLRKNVLVLHPVRLCGFNLPFLQSFDGIEIGGKPWQAHLVADVARVGRNHVQPQLFQPTRPERRFCPLPDATGHRFRHGHHDFAVVSAFAHQPPFL